MMSTRANSLGGIKLVAIALLTLVGCSGPASQTDPVITSANNNEATLYVNATILTMNDAQPNADALAIKDGKIIAVGSRAEVETIAGVGATIRDMDGKTILPGLIDAHGHFVNGALTATMADLQPPPAGGVQSLSELSEALLAWQANNPQSAWIMGYGYDDSLLAEARHPTREDLDQVSADLPIMLLHVSMHLLTCNTACLEAVGVSAETPDPVGGVIRRIPGTQEPDGVFEETAMQLVLAKFPRPSVMQLVDAMQVQQALYARHGITTAQEGAGSAEQLAGVQALAASGALKLDIVGYQVIRQVSDFDPAFETSQTYNNHYRTGGIKLILDGSPQGKTAWLTHPYHVSPEGVSEAYLGYPIMQSTDVGAILIDAFSRGVQVIAHANGDAAADQLLTGVTAANATLGHADRRTVMIHAQTVRDDQIAVMKSEGVIPSYFVAHTFFWGDWHRDSVLGPERGARISPLNTTLALGVPFTIHNDAPVIPPDMMRLVWSAVNRETRSGQVLGAEERITPMDALKAITIDAAYQYFEEDHKGSLEVGKQADLVILSHDPTSVAPDMIKDIEILETIKDGETVFVAE